MIAQRSGGRFFGRRVNCEQVPLLPAWAVAQVFDDPKETPHPLAWNSAGTVQERVHIHPFDETPMKPMLAMWRLDIAPHNSTGGVEIKRDDGTTDIIRTLLQPLPRNGGSVRLSHLPGLSDSAPRAVSMEARRTVQHQRRAVELAVSSL